MKVTEIWENAQRTTNANMRYADSVKLVRDGRWIFAQDQSRLGANWWVYDTETGERIKTGCATMTDVNRFMYDRNRANNSQVTVAGGPGRAISARRYTKVWQYQ